MARKGLGNRGQSEWSSVYLIIVFMIAALLLIALIKPMFQSSRSIRKSPVIS